VTGWGGGTVLMFVSSSACSSELPASIMDDGPPLSINQSIKQVYCTALNHVIYVINLANKNKRGKKSHMSVYM